MKRRILVVQVSTTIVFTIAYLIASKVAAASYPEYEVHRTRTLVSPAGEVFTSVLLDAGRKDGATVSGQTGFDHSRTCTGVRIVIPSAKASTTVDYCSQKKSTFPQPNLAPEVHAPDCRDKVGDDLSLVGTTSISGVKTLHYFGDVGYGKHDVYLAPTMGCVVLKSSILWKKNGSFTGGKTLEDAFSVRQGTVDPALFDVPTYDEVRPSEMKTARWNLVAPGTSCPACFSRLNAQLDEKYFKAHSLH